MNYNIYRNIPNYFPYSIMKYSITMIYKYWKYFLQYQEFEMLSNKKRYEIGWSIRQFKGKPDEKVNE